MRCRMSLDSKRLVPLSRLVWCPRGISRSIQERSEGGKIHTELEQQAPPCVLLLVIWLCRLTQLFERIRK